MTHTNPNPSWQPRLQRIGLAATAGARRLALDVAVGNDGAKRLYERRGMTIDATSPPIPLMGGTAVHRMTKAV